MTMNKSAIAAAMIATLGTVGAMSTASAAVVVDGTYNLVINTTPVFTDAYGYTSYKFGKAGAWNSSFTFGGNPPAASSQAMVDTGSTVASNGGPRGSGIGGDGVAGILGITVSGNAFSVNGVASMGGTIDQTTGAMTLNVTGRLGAVASFPSLYDEAWNVNNCNMQPTGCINNGNTAWTGFTTGTANAINGSGILTSVTGNAVVATADQNADGIADYKATLVSGGQVGSAFGGFFGAGYYEVWSVKLLSTNAGGLHSGFNVDTIPGTAGGDFAQYAPIPVPAAAWLFGSGLVGLVGVARRKK